MSSSFAQAAAVAARTLAASKKAAPVVKAKKVRAVVAPAAVEVAPVVKAKKVRAVVANTEAVVKTRTPKRIGTGTGVIKNVETIKPNKQQRAMARQLVAELGVDKEFRERDFSADAEYDRNASRVRATTWFDMEQDQPEYVGVYQITINAKRRDRVFAKWTGKRWVDINTGNRMPAEYNTWRGLSTSGYALYLQQIAAGQRELIAVPKKSA